MPSPQAAASRDARPPVPGHAGTLGAPTSPAEVSGTSTFRALLRLAGWARPARRRIMLGGASALAASLLALAVPQVLGEVINGPLLSSGSSAAVFQAVGLVLVLGVLEAVLVWSRRALIATPGTGIERAMRSSLFRHLLDLPVAFHDRWAGGQLLQRSMGDLGTVRRWMVFGLVQLVVSVTTILAGVALLVATSAPLGLVYVVGTAPVIWLGFRFRRDYTTVARRARDQAGDLASSVEESVHGIRVLKAFGRGEDALEDFVRQADELRSTELDKSRAESRMSLVLTWLPESTLALSLGLGVWLTAEGHLQVGGLVAFFATAAVMTRPVEGIGRLLAMTLDARAAADRFFDVMDTPPSLRDPDRPVPLPRRPEHGSRVEFRDVHFAHAGPGRQTPGTGAPGEERSGKEILRGVDLELRPGETLALVGLTGSGKSTALQLVPRLQDVTGGAVLLDGVDVRDLTRDELRSAVSVAFEDPVLFSASVTDNVLMGVPPERLAELSPSQARDLVATALDAAQAGFVHRLPYGLDTVIGEEGLSLSGGQRQRVALARAIVGGPRVLVLDDPLSALDVTTEAAVTGALRDLLRTTTTLVVAHRTSTVALADRVALLADGRISAVGQHSDLLASNPHYRYVLTAQASNGAQGGTDAQAQGTHDAQDSNGKQSGNGTNGMTVGTHTGDAP